MTNGLWSVLFTYWDLELVMIYFANIMVQNVDWDFCTFWKLINRSCMYASLTSDTCPPPSLVSWVLRSNMWHGNYTPFQQLCLFKSKLMPWGNTIFFYTSYVTGNVMTNDFNTFIMTMNLKTHLHELANVISDLTCICNKSHVLLPSLYVINTR